jgi:hypothetical protein
MAARTTQYGFKFEAATVERLASHKGYAIIGVKTPRQMLEIQVTPTGLLKVRGPVKLETDLPRA